MATIPMKFGCSPSLEIELHPDGCFFLKPMSWRLLEGKRIRVSMENHFLPEATFTRDLMIYTMFFSYCEC